MFLESEKGTIKLVLVLATSMQVNKTREKMAEAARAGKNEEESKDEYPENFARVPYIR